MCRSYVLVRRNKHGKDLKTCVMCFFMFMVKKPVYLIYALLSRIKFCRDYALFKGHFWPKFDGRGHGNILKDRAESYRFNSSKTEKKCGNDDQKS